MPNQDLDNKPFNPNPLTSTLSKQRAYIMHGNARSLEKTASEDPSFRSNQGIPIKGAATSDFAKHALPKNFSQPLTCFYWSKHGSCTKTDEECIYAHYNTGIVAQAPIKLTDGQETVAGRNANAMINVHAKVAQVISAKEQEYHARELAVAAKEQKLHARELAVALKESMLEDSIKVRELYDMLGKFRETVRETYDALADRCNDFDMHATRAPTREHWDSYRMALGMIGGMLGELTDLVFNFDRLEESLNKKPRV